MTAPLPRPLTPLESAILRAVVELGDEAHTENIREVAARLLSKRVSPIQNYLKWLAIDGYLVQVSHDYECRKGRARKYWRPACDLTAVTGMEREQINE